MRVVATCFESEGKGMKNICNWQIYQLLFVMIQVSDVNSAGTSIRILFALSLNFALA